MTTSQTQDFMRAHLENMVAMAQGAATHGIDVSPAQLVSGVESALLDLIRTSFPLEHMLNTSDLVFHAEGPAVHGDSPALSAFNWLSRATETALRKLSANMFDLSTAHAKAFGSALDLRLTGMAPGSLYIGIALDANGSGMFPSEDEPVFTKLRQAFRALPAATNTIGDEAMLPGIQAIVPDAAERDATLAALLRMAPTGKQGIHTLDIAAPGTPRGTLSQRERVVLREALRKPTLVNAKEGVFVGEVREADLDKFRVHLRNVQGLGSLRCVLPATMDSAKVKALFGEQARLSGRYEADRSGRPRLLLVEHIEVVERPVQQELA